MARAGHVRRALEILAARVEDDERKSSQGFRKVSCDEQRILTEISDKSAQMFV
jgi:hypothetical protein